MLIYNTLIIKYIHNAHHKKRRETCTCTAKTLPLQTVLTIKSESMDEVVIWLIAVPIIILEIVMIVKFFQIASDIRTLKHYFVDSYKTLKTKDIDGNSVEFDCYKEDLLKPVSKEEWENTRENALKPMIDDYNKTIESYRRKQQQ